MSNPPIKKNIPQAEKDFKRVIANTRKLESLYDQGKLSYGQITKIQDNLDTIAAKYKDDSTFKLYLYLLLEQQALIHFVNGNEDGFTKFYQDALDTKPTGANFVSEGASRWEADSIAETRQTTANNSFRKQDSPFYKRKGLWAVAIVILAIFLWQPIANEITLATANPTMVKLAKDANMSRSGELLFLGAHPELDSAYQFPNNCPTASANNNGTSLLGCYNPNTNRIYLLSMPSSLYDQEVSTAAYEMLHIVYIQLAQTGSTQLNQAIENNYSALDSDPNLSGQVSTFAKTEPGDRDLELFSILCTEYGDLSLTSSLVNYCSPYFKDDMAAVVNDNNQIDNLFTSDQNQLNQLQSTITQDENNANTAYNDSVGWANEGNQYEDTYNYNIYSQYYNAANTAVNQYNSLLNTYNTLVTAITGGQPINQAQTPQQQSAQ